MKFTAPSTPPVNLVKVKCPNCTNTWLTTYTGRLKCVNQKHFCNYVFIVENHTVPEPVFEVKHLGK